MEDNNKDDIVNAGITDERPHNVVLESLNNRKQFPFITILENDKFKDQIEYDNNTTEI